jgi:hypothetical protein
MRMNIEVSRDAISEQELFVRAADWLAGNELDARALRRLASEHGLDLATAVLCQGLRRSERHGPLIARLEQPVATSPTRADADVVIVPGAFYKQSPHTGANGKLVEQTARDLGYSVLTVSLLSFGSVSANAEVLADWLRRRDRPMWVFSHSKGTTEIRRLLARPDAAELLRLVRGWVDLSGLFLGTPLIEWLRTQRVRRLLIRLYFWWSGYTYSALDEISKSSCPPWPAALEHVPHLDVIHLVGFPLERHLTTPLIRRGYRRLSPLGPNDGTILLEDVLALPGRVYPIWGADHYLQPTGRDMSEVIAAVLNELARCASEG